MVTFNRSNPRPDHLSNVSNVSFLTTLQQNSVHYFPQYTKIMKSYFGQLFCNSDLILRSVTQKIVFCDLRAPR